MKYYLVSRELRILLQVRSDFMNQLHTLRDRSHLKLRHNTSTTIFNRVGAQV